jgi:hypothetical protein
VAEVKAHWPDDAIEVTVDGQRRWWLKKSSEVDVESSLLRLLGGYDLFLQGRDRGLIVPDTARHKALWPVLGRPGAVLCGAEIVGTWRPKTAGDKLSLRLELWSDLSKAARARLTDEAEKLAAHRGLRLAAVIDE